MTSLEIHCPRRGITHKREGWSKTLFIYPYLCTTLELHTWGYDHPSLLWPKSIAVEAKSREVKGG